MILSGGPASVYADGAPGLDTALFDAGVPVFGICYGFQAMAQALGGYTDELIREDSRWRFLSRTVSPLIPAT